MLSFIESSFTTRVEYDDWIRSGAASTEPPALTPASSPAMNEPSASAGEFHCGPASASPSEAQVALPAPPPTPPATAAEEAGDILSDRERVRLALASVEPPPTSDVGELAPTGTLFITTHFGGLSRYVGEWVPLSAKDVQCDQDLKTRLHKSAYYKGFMEGINRGLAYRCKHVDNLFMLCNVKRLTPKELAMRVIFETQWLIWSGGEHRFSGPTTEVYTPYDERYLDEGLDNAIMPWQVEADSWQLNVTCAKLERRYEDLYSTMKKGGSLTLQLKIQTQPDGLAATRKLQNEFDDLPVSLYLFGRTPLASEGFAHTKFLGTYELQLEAQPVRDRDCNVVVDAPLYPVYKLVKSMPKTNSSLFAMTQAVLFESQEAAKEALGIVPDAFMVRGDDERWYLSPTKVRPSPRGAVFRSVDRGAPHPARCQGWECREYNNPGGAIVHEWKECPGERLLPGVKLDVSNDGMYKGVALACTEDKGNYDAYVEKLKELDGKDAGSAELRHKSARECYMKDLKMGDHILMPTIGKGRIYHHALVASDPDEEGCFELIHFLNIGMEHLVKNTDDFRLNNRDWVWVLPRDKYYALEAYPKARIRDTGEGDTPGEKIIDFAWEVLTDGQEDNGKTHGFGKDHYVAYHPQGSKANNCEHFCTYCVIGEKYCLQVDKSNGDLGWGLGGVAAGVGAGGWLYAVEFAVCPPAAIATGAVVAAAGAGLALWNGTKLGGRAADSRQEGGGASGSGSDDKKGEKDTKGPRPANGYGSGPATS